MSNYSLNPYFKHMQTIGSPIKAANQENFDLVRQVEMEIQEAIEKAQATGKPDEKVNERGEWTALQRLAELVDEGTWCPLNSLFDPGDNDTGSTGIIKGLGRINGKWAMIIASDNKKLAGAWFLIKLKILLEHLIQLRDLECL